MPKSDLVHDLRIKDLNPLLEIEEDASNEKWPYMKVRCKSARKSFPYSIPKNANAWSLHSALTAISTTWLRLRLH